MQETPTEIAVIVSAIERLLEAPIQPATGSSGALHRLELLKGGVDTLVGQQRPLPVALEGQEALRERIGVVGADEVAAVLPKDLPHIRVGVPSQGAPDGLVD